MTTVKSDPFKLLAGIVAVASLLGGIWSWADSLNDATAANAQRIEVLQRIDDEHKEDHKTFREEYREDMKAIDAKLDRLLEASIANAKSD